MLKEPVEPLVSIAILKSRVQYLVLNHRTLSLMEHLVKVVVHGTVLGKLEHRTSLCIYEVGAAPWRVLRPRPCSSFERLPPSGITLMSGHEVGVRRPDLQRESYAY